jgi:hypothetical protein
MFSGFWVWSKALGINSTDFSAGVPNLTPQQTRALDYSLLDYDRPHNITLNAIYQMKSYTENKALGCGDQRLAALGRVPLDRAVVPYGVGYSIPGIGAANLTGSSDGNPNARIVVTCDPGKGYSWRSVQAAQHGLFRAAAAGQQRQRVVTILRARAADQQPRHVALEEIQDLLPDERRVPGRHVQRAEPHAVHRRQRDSELRQL